MSDVDEFEKQLRRMNKSSRNLSGLFSWLGLAAGFMLIFAIVAAQWFVYTALVTGGLAWLFGVSDPKEVAIFWGCVSIPAAFIVSAVMFRWKR